MQLRGGSAYIAKVGPFLIGGSMPARWRWRNHPFTAMRDLFAHGDTFRVEQSSIYRCTIGSEAWQVHHVFPFTVLEQPIQVNLNRRTNRRIITDFFPKIFFIFSSLNAQDSHKFLLPKGRRVEHEEERNKAQIISRGRVGNEYVSPHGYKKNDH